MRRAQHLEVQQALDRDVHRVVRLAGQDGVGEGIGQAGAAGLAGDVLLDVALAVQRVDDRAIAGAAADIALERMRQVGLVRLVERGRGRRHDHAGRAVAALEGLRIVERLLDGMHLAVLGEALDGRDLAALAAEGGHQAGVERLAVEPHRAGAAVAGVAALLDAEHLQVAQEGAQALAGLRFGRVPTAIDLVVAHDSSARILFGKVVGDVALVGRRAVDVLEPGVRRQAFVDRLTQFGRRRRRLEPQMHRPRRRGTDRQQEVLALVADGSDDQRGRAAEVSERHLAHGEALGQGRGRQEDRSQRLALLEDVGVHAGDEVDDRNLALACRCAATACRRLRAPPSGRSWRRPAATCRCCRRRSPRSRS